MRNGTTAIGGGSSTAWSAEDFASQVLAIPTPGEAGEAEGWLPTSPFLETFAVDSPSRESEQSEGLTAPTFAVESPFRSEYAEALESDGGGAEREAYATLVAELYDRQFAESLDELAGEAFAALTEQFGVAGLAAGESEQFVERYMSPIGREAETLFERLGEQYAQHDIAALNEDEIDRLFESMAPTFGHLSPAGEDFLGGLWNKVKAVAKGAVNLAKKGIAAVGKVLPIGAIFQAIKRLVRPLLQRVLQFAIGRLPSPLQPIARQLAAKLFGAREAEASELEDFGVPGEAFGVPHEEATEFLAAPDSDAVAREFDARAAALMFVPESEWESQAESWVPEAPSGELEALDAARERFVTEIGAARTEAEVAAAMENFIPAIMAALRIGITIIGRDRVVGFLAKLLAKLVGKLVGPQVAGPLSQAIVSTGMSMIGLETPAEREALASEAAAAAVEGTMRRLAEQGESLLTDQRLLEASVSEAFAEAAAEAFPPAVVRESLQEVASSARPKGTWVWRPVRGPRRYRKYTQVLDATVTRQVAGTVRGFGGISLAAFLSSRYGVTGVVRARAYLYESVPGTMLSQVARAEKGVPGLGPNARKGWRFFLPLTRGNAAALFGEPGLGRDVAPEFLRSSRRIAAGQRFVVLVPESRAGDRATRDVSRASQVNLVLDLPRSRIAVLVHLTEADAQSVAGPLRRGEQATGGIALVLRILRAGVDSIFSGSPTRHVTIIHEAAAHEQFLGAAFSALGRGLLSRLRGYLLRVIESAIAEFLTRRAREFVVAADAPSQGVTMELSITDEGLAQLIRDALSGRNPGPAAVLRAMSTLPTITVRTHPGFRDR